MIPRFLFVCAATVLAAPAGAEPLHAVAGRVHEEGAFVVLSFDLDGKAEAASHALKGPDRLVIDLPAVGFFLEPSLGRDLSGKPGGGLIKSFRFGGLNADSSRIVIDLAKPACVQKIEDSPLVAGAAATRLDIVLMGCGRAAFEAALQAEPRQTAAAPVAPPPPGDSRPVVVIDPGHGGIDGGAFGAGGAVEKGITLAFALALKERLDGGGRYRVVMTRTDDSFVSLPDRVKLARDAGAALFISIHADTLSDGADVSGGTVYSGAERASDGVSARIAARENAADKAAGADLKEEKAGVSDILFDLQMRESRAYTHLFSHGLMEAWRKAGRLANNPERAANFYVLKAPDYPSVLMELGFLSNAEDVKALKSPEWRAKTSEAMAKAIDGFFAAGGGSAPPPAAASR